MHVPSHVNVRLGDDLRSRLGKFAEQHGLTVSQALRLVLEQGLRSEDLPRDEAWRQASFKEGVNQGLAACKAEIMGALYKLWGRS